MQNKEFSFPTIKAALQQKYQARWTELLSMELAGTLPPRLWEANIEGQQMIDQLLAIAQNYAPTGEVMILPNTSHETPWNEDQTTLDDEEYKSYHDVNSYSQRAMLMIGSDVIPVKVTLYTHYEDDLDSGLHAASVEQETLDSDILTCYEIANLDGSELLAMLMQQLRPGKRDLQVEVKIQLAGANIHEVRLNLEKVHHQVREHLRNLSENTNKQGIPKDPIDQQETHWQIRVQQEQTGEQEKAVSIQSINGVVSSGENL